MDEFDILTATDSVDVDQWWQAAKRFPVEAMQSPLFDVLTLEAPERWVAYWQDIDLISNHWIPRYHSISCLGTWKAWSYHVDCLERLLPLFDANDPADSIPHDILAVYRRHIPGTASGEDESKVLRLQLAMNMARAGSAAKTTKEKGLRQARQAIMDAPYHNGSTPNRVRQILHVWKGGNPFAEPAQVFSSEIHWQWERLLNYVPKRGIHG